MYIRIPPCNLQRYSYNSSELMLPLSPQAVHFLTHQANTPSPLTVAIKNIKTTLPLISFDIWDEHNKARGFVNLQQTPDCDPHHLGIQLQPGKFMIRIQEYSHSQLNSKQLIQIVKLAPINQLEEKQQVSVNSVGSIQEEKPENTDKLIQTGQQRLHRINKKQISTSHKGQFCHNSNQNTGGTLYEVDEPSPPELITPDRFKQFENISDLYVDFQNWQLLVRVVEISYKEFKSKQGKMIKLLTLELMDRTGLKIEATLFGEQAKEEHMRIKKGSVYRIAKGQIKEHFYGQTMAQNISKLNIILFRDSDIIEVQDIPQIPNSKELSMSLNQVLSDLNYERYYDLLVVLLQIGEEKEIEKQGGKRVAKRHFVVGDPETRKCIECIIWSKTLEVDEKWLLKPIILKSFRLNNYRDTLSLCSVFRSQVHPRPKSYLARYESIIQDMEFTDINSKFAIVKPTPTEIKVTETRTIRQLENQISYLPYLGSITSELEVYVTFVKLQGKWAYGACNNPRCKKAAESYNKCAHCGSYNEAINRKYMLPVELSDHTGSIWTTAFDDFANMIFQGTTLEQLQQVQDNKLKEFVDKYMYQQFKVRILTKRENQHLIRHSLSGKPQQMNIDSCLKINLARISGAIEQ